MACSTILGLGGLDYSAGTDGAAPANDAATDSLEQVFLDDATVAPGDVVQGRWQPLALAASGGTVYAFLNNRGNLPAGGILGCSQIAVGAWSCTPVENPDHQNILAAPVGTLTSDASALVSFEAPWAGGSAAISTCPLQSGACGTVTTHTVPARVYGIAVDNQYVHYTTASSVLRCALPSCSTPIVTFESDAGTPNFVASDGVYVYWSSETAQTHFILACPIDSCTTPLQRNAGGQTLALTASPSQPGPGTVYWISEVGAASVLQSWCPNCTGGDAGLAPVVVSVGILGSLLGDASAPTSPSAATTRMAVDDTYVYWTYGALPPGGGYDGQGGPGGVAACPRAGCSPDHFVVIATNQTGAGPIAVDNSRVYWAAYTTTDFATLWAQAKP